MVKTWEFNFPGRAVKGGGMGSVGWVEGILGKGIRFF